MRNRLIQLEQERLKSMGYDSIVTTVALNVDKTLVNHNLGNDTYILTGIRLSPADIYADVHNVCISSATDGIEATQQELASMGDAIYRTFRNHIIVKTNDNSDWEVTDIPRFALDFIKITPIKK